MNRGTFRCAAAASAVFVISLHCEISEAADPGFYVGAAGARSEQRLDQDAGVGPVPIAVLPPPDPFNPGPVVPAPRPPIPLNPIFGGAADREISADEIDVGWNFALGYRVNKYFAAELGYVDAGEASLTERYPAPPSTSPIRSDLTRSYRVHSRGPAVSLLGSLPLNAQWQVFARGGVLFAEQEIESRTSLAGGAAPVNIRTDRDYSDEVVSLGAGVQWAFLPRWTARLEYQRTDDLKQNDIMGESRLDQASLSVLFDL